MLRCFVRRDADKIRHSAPPNWQTLRLRRLADALLYDSKCHQAFSGRDERILRWPRFPTEHTLCLCAGRVANLAKHREERPHLGIEHRDDSDQKVRQLT